MGKDDCPLLISLLPWSLQCSGNSIHHTHTHTHTHTHICNHKFNFKMECSESEGGIYRTKLASLERFRMCQTQIKERVEHA